MKKLLSLLLALCLAFSMVTVAVASVGAAEVGADASTGASTKTVYVGVITYLNLNANSYQVRYWGGADGAKDANLTATGKTAQQAVGSAYWSNGAQTFNMYTATVPADATGFKVHNGNTWFGSTDGNFSTQNTAYVFEYGGNYNAYYSYTQEVVETTAAPTTEAPAVETTAAPVVETTAAPAGDTITVYFTDAQSYGDVNVYYWPNGGEWPGAAATKTETNDFGQQIYSAVIPADVEGIIFNGNGRQTVDITEGIADGAWWYSVEETDDQGHNYVNLVGAPEETTAAPVEDTTAAPVEDTTAAPVEDTTAEPSGDTITVYFTDAQYYGDVNVYYWPNGGEWPGTAATKTETNDFGQQIYSAVIPADVEGIIFNGNGRQTVDITEGIEDGAWWYTKDTTDESGHNYVELVGAPEETTAAPVEDTTAAPVEDTTAEPSGDTTYYLFGYINGADYACEADADNMGTYKFVDGTLKATFTQDSYVGVKTEGNANWYMTDGWAGEVTTVTLYNTSVTGEKSDKLFVPGGVEVTFTLTEGANDTLTLSYTTAAAETTAAPVVETTEAPVVETTEAPVGDTITVYFTDAQFYGDVNVYYWPNGGEWPGTAATKTETNDFGQQIYSAVIPADVEGIIFNGNGRQTVDITEGIEDGAWWYTKDTTDESGHNYVELVGAPEETTAAPVEDTTAAPVEDTTAEPSGDTTYYLFGYINGADYACEADADNMGTYKFVDGTLKATFTQDSYVGVKTEGNANWYMTDGWAGEVTTVTLYNTSVTGVNSDKLMVPGGVEVTFTLTEGADDTLTLSYTTAASEDTTAAPVEDTTAAPVEDTTAEPSGDTITVYFTDAQYYGDVNVYYWPNGGEWPGTAATKTETNDFGQQIYSAVIPADVEGIIFNGNGRQTVDITEGIADGAWWYSVEETDDQGHNYVNLVGAPEETTAAPAEDTTAAPVEDTTAAPVEDTTAEPSGDTITVYFTDAQYYGDVNVYYWPNGGEWPGTAATKTETNDFGQQIYSAVIPADVEGIIFNGNGRQTVDITEGIADGAWWYTKDTTDESGHNYVELVGAPEETTAAPVEDTTAAPVEDTTAEPSGDTTYYLFGYINGADYACEADADNMGTYKFVDGTLKATFTQDSYVGVKTEGNANWYMTDGWAGEVTTVTLYNTSVTGVNSDKLMVPGGVEVTFTLTEGADDTLTLSYTTAASEDTTAAPVEDTTAAPVEDTTAEPSGDTITVYFTDAQYYGDVNVYYWPNGGEWPGTAATKTETNDFGQQIYSAVIPADVEGIIFNGNGRQTVDITEGIADGAWWYSVEETDDQGHNYVNLVGAPEETTAAPVEDTTAAPVEDTTAEPSGDTITVYFTDAQYYGDVNVYYWPNGGEWPGTAATKTETNDFGQQIYSAVIPADVEGIIFNGNGRQTVDITEGIADGAWWYSVEETDDQGHNYVKLVGAPEETTAAPVEDTTAAPVEDTTAEPSGDTTYYLFGYINGADYACEADADNMGTYKFVDGTLKATFTQDSYVGVKTEGNANWYMTDGWAGEVTTVTLYNTSVTGVNSDKLFVPGGVEVTFTLTEGADDTLTLSYTTGEPEETTEAPAEDTTAAPAEDTTAAPSGDTITVYFTDAQFYGDVNVYYWPNGGEWPGTAATKTETNDFGQQIYSAVIPADVEGIIFNGNGRQTVDITEGIADGAWWYTVEETDDSGHNYVELVGDVEETTAAPVEDTTAAPVEDTTAEPSGDTTYYLFGYINGADYACEADAANMGTYKFVDGTLKATFTQDSYVGVKTEGNANWYMTDGWAGEVTTVTLYNTSVTGVNSDKLFVPGNVEVTFTLTEGADDTLTLSYTTGEPEETTEAPVEDTTAEPTVEPTTEEPTVEPTTEEPTEEPTTEEPSDDTFVVAGDPADIFGTAWDETNEDNLMTAQAGGVFTKDYTVNKAYTDVQLKAVKNGADWYGDETGNNVTFNLTGAGTFTVTATPVDDGYVVSVSGDIVEFVTVFEYDSVFAVGNGEGTWLNDASWDTGFLSNEMTEVADDVWEISFEGVGEGFDRQIKFAIDGKWTHNFGGTYDYDLEGQAQDAVYNGDNITFDTEFESQTVKVQLDLTEFNFSTKTGAKFTITITESGEEPILGDVDGSGTVTIDDATMIQRYLAEFITLTDEQKALADTNKDGKVSIRDVTEIQRYLAEIIDAF